MENRILRSLCAIIYSSVVGCDMGDHFVNGYDRTQLVCLEMLLDRSSLIILLHDDVSSVFLNAVFSTEFNKFQNPNLCIRS